MSEKSYYDILEVSKDATPTEINKKFKLLAKKYHPDKLPKEQQEEGTRKFKEINEAYHILSDTEKRETYDKYGKEGLNGPGMEGFDENIFEHLFNMRKEPQEVNHIKCSETVTLEDIYNGKKIKKVIRRKSLCKQCEFTGFSDKKNHSCQQCKGKGKYKQVQQVGPGMYSQVNALCKSCRGKGADNSNVSACDHCKGSKFVTEETMIEVMIPTGVSSEGENYIVIENQGDEILPELRSQFNGATRGRVVIILEESKHNVFKRSFDSRSTLADLSIKLELSLDEALCGFVKAIKHLDGRQLYFRENNIINEGDVKVIKNEGLKYRDSNKKGDLLIKYTIIFPEKLNKEQKENIYKILTGKDLTYESSIPAGAIKVECDAFDTKESKSQYRSNSHHSKSNYAQNGSVQCPQQ